jgi:outer membrane protein assembly factor BamB
MSSVSSGIAVLCLLVPALEVAAEQADTARDIIEAAGVRGGLVVHVGCGDGRLTAALRAGDGHLVHGLDADPAHVAAARRHVAELGLSGKVSVDRLPPGHLPYVDNLVRLLVAEDPSGLSADEIMRVLAPGGVAYLKSGGGWRKSVKPWPETIDREWTHYLRGPDNNAVARDSVVGPPRHVQWLAGPRWTRNHHTLSSVSSAVTADGRLFHLADEASPANIRLPARWAVVARDAFSGVTLWKKPIQSWVDHRHPFRQGPPQAPRLLVASADRLYTSLELSGPVSALDAATGETVESYPETVGAEEIVLVNDTLLVLVGAPEAEQAFAHPAPRQQQRPPNEKSLLAVDTATGKTLWRWQPGGRPAPKTLASDGARAYVRMGDGAVGLDLRSGRQLWRYGDVTAARGGGITFGRDTLVVAQGVVLFTVGGKLAAVSAEDGTELWQREAGSGFHAPPDLFVIGELVWHKTNYYADSNPPVASHPEIEAMDLRTGEVRVRDSIADQVKTGGHHYRCHRAKATSRFVIAGKRGVEMIDLGGEDHSRNNWVRGACQYGVLPANGLLYVPPHSCGCYMETMLHGFWALAARQPATTDAKHHPAEGARLEKGPAYGRVGEAPTREADDWPTYRGDPLRRAVAAAEVPPRLRQEWQARLGGRLTQPVVAGGCVLVADADGGMVYALDEASGHVRWRHLAGGRVDSPPTIHEGTALFGSADGRVTCLRLSDGEMVWRFLAAPADLRTVAMDRLESLWPVHGSVLLLNGVAYCSAGRSSWLDGGIHLYGLDPATGKVIHANRYESRHPRFRRDEGPERKPEHERIDQNLADYKTFDHPDRSDAFSMAGGSISDVLVSDGWSVFLHHKKFNAALEKQEGLSRHLFSTSSLLDDAENHRSHWFLGTGDFSRLPVAYSWIVNSRGGSRGNATVAVPTGLIMAYDDRAVWGVQRRELGQAAIGDYLLFKMDNRPFAVDEPSLPDFRPAPPREYVYRVELPARPRGIVKSGKHLFLAVMPTDIPDDDPHASYEGRRGGAVLVCAEDEGTVLAEHRLDSPAVWDGMAAANGRLYVATVDGRVLCLAGD